MTPQKQLTDNDCLRACIATLMDYNIHKVPNFVDVGEELINGFPAWWQALQSWMNELGLFFLEIRMPDNFPWQPLPLPALCIFFGETSKGIKHAVVGRVEDDQFIPIFNPHPAAGALTSVSGIGFLVPRDPLNYVRFGHTITKIERLSRDLFSPAKQEEIHAIAEQCLNLTSIESKIQFNGAGKKLD